MGLLVGAYMGGKGICGACVPCMGVSHLISSHLTSPNLVIPDLDLLHLPSPPLASPRPPSPPLASPHHPSQLRAGLEAKLKRASATKEMVLTLTTQPNGQVKSEVHPLTAMVSDSICLARALALLCRL